MSPDTRDEKTILIVEDEPPLAEMYADFLGETYRTIIAKNGETALESIDNSVDVVVLDRRMPGLSGDEVLERIRDQGYDVRVAMVTAVKPDFDILDMPFDAYLTKPVSLSDLRKTIEDLLALDSFNEAVKESYALSAKRTALESSMFLDELESNEEYISLTNRLDELSRELDAASAEFDLTQHKRLYKQLGMDEETS